MMSSKFRFLDECFDDEEGPSRIGSTEEIFFTVPGEILDRRDLRTVSVSSEKNILRVPINLDSGETISIKLSQPNDICLKSLGEKEEHIAKYTDVLMGRYEGGFKLWECSIDLVRYLNDNLVFGNLKSKAQTRALELGCGHGIPGICLVKMGIEHVCFQDLNREVLLNNTMQNVMLNTSQRNLDDCSFLSGDWRGFDKLVDPVSKFDLIVTSETIYDQKQFDVLHALFEKFLAPAGRIIIAAKRFYFGVGGGTFPFKQFLERMNMFRIVDTKLYMDGSSNTREVLELSFLQLATDQV